MIGDWGFGIWDFLDLGFEIVSIWDMGLRIWDFLDLGFGISDFGLIRMMVPHF